MPSDIEIGSHGTAPAPCTRSVFSPETFCVRGFTPFFSDTGAISTPIVLSSTFHHPSLGESTGFDYSRGLNPTRLELERTVATMEHAKYALAFSSGMAAISCLVKHFDVGDEIIVSNDLYGGTWRIFAMYEKYGLHFHYVDTSDISLIQAALTEKTRALFVETPSNPMMKITDLAACAALIHAHRKDGLLIVGNTFLSPYLQNPIDFGADIIVHSGTKYLSGHHDVIAGLLVYNRKEEDDFFRLTQMSEGASLSPFDSWLVLRGIKTLPVRIDRANENAKKLADFLRAEPFVEHVYFAGFADAPGHEVFKKQSRGTGSMISFTVRDARAIPVILKSLILFAESLGGVQSLMTYPATQTHAAIPQALREAVGVTDRLLRLSVGIESADELIADLRQALEAGERAL